MNRKPRTKPLYKGKEKIIKDSIRCHFIFMNENVSDEEYEFLDNLTEIFKKIKECPLCKSKEISEEWHGPNCPECGRFIFDRYGNVYLNSNHGLYLSKFNNESRFIGYISYDAINGLIFDVVKPPYQSTLTGGKIKDGEELYIDKKIYSSQCDSRCPMMKYLPFLEQQKKINKFSNHKVF